MCSGGGCHKSLLPAYYTGVTTGGRSQELPPAPLNTAVTAAVTPVTAAVTAVTDAVTAVTRDV